MDIANKNTVRISLILLGVILAVLIGFSSNALPVNSNTEVSLNDLFSDKIISEVGMSLMVKANSIIFYIFN